MESPIHSIGVLTGGGDAPGLNAVIRAVVKTAKNEYGWEVLGIKDGFEGLIHPGKIHPLDQEDVRGILPRGGTILGTTNRGDPFRYEVEVDGKIETYDLSNDVVHKAKVLGIDALIVIGGDGSLRIAMELVKKGLKVVGVPKTIDNDIQETDITFGFDTAVNTATDAIDRLHTTAESHDRTIILELMGRDAGWIALRSGIAGGADVILIPEIPYRLDEIIRKIEVRNARGATFSIIVVAEGAYPEGGQPLYQMNRTVGGVHRLGGIGEVLAEELRTRTNNDIRVTVLGHLQRGGTPSAYDRQLATRFGSMAVHLAAQGKFGHMVALHGEKIEAVPIADAITSQKFIPLDSDEILTAQSLYISLGNTRQAIEKLREERS
ncbi:MAG: ATP-dependent 6-phosphofructokinase [Chloroflexi bacterium]|nr:MAG: ATP-dependent 6-phosphofructokinase [Chloroflexota bacterium]